MFVDTEYVEGVVPISSHIEGYPPQNGSINLRKGSRSLRDRERSYLGHNNTNKVLPQTAHSTRVHVHQKNDQIKVHDDQENACSQYLSKYNNLLKAGR